MAKKTPPASNRRFGGLLAIIAVLGIGAIGYSVMKPKPQARIIDPNTPLPEAKGHFLGSDSAPVLITMYADFECPGCGQFATVTEPDVRTRIINAGLARFQFVDFPLDQAHKNTMIAHNAAWCAGAQDKFWQMHDRIYEMQGYWSDLLAGKDAHRAEDAMSDYAKEVGVDVKAFEACMLDRTYELQIRANQKQGVMLGVGGTPTFVIGNRMLPAGVGSYDVLKATVDSVTAEMKKAKK